MSLFLSLNLSSNEIHSLLFERQAGLYALRAQNKMAFELDDAERLMPAFWEQMQALEAETGIKILDDDGHLAHEGHAELTGMSAVGFSFSASRPVRVGLVGISEAYSLSSLRRLVSLFDAEVVLETRLQDPLSQSQQLEALRAVDLDMLVIAGGSEEGASRALRNAIENARLFYHLMPKSIQPQIVYAGNQVLADYARLEIEAGDDFHLAPNLHHNTGEEDLSVAWKAMLRAYQRVRLQQYPHLRHLQAELKTALLPASFAMGRLARFIARLSATDKAVLLADLSDEKTSLLFANKNELMAISQANTIDEALIQSTQAYCSQNLTTAEVGEFLLNQSLNPHQLSVTISDFAIEQAWARARLCRALGAMKAIYPHLKYDGETGLHEACDPIILSGSAFSDKLKAHQSLAVALDGILPHGISTIAMDDNHLLRALGTLADKEPLLVVQMLELDSFRNLASVVSVDNQNYEDHALLDLELVLPEDDSRQYFQAGRNQLCKIDTRGIESMRVYLAPGRFSDVGMGMVGLGGWISVPDTELGLIIDARGRPLILPENPEARAKSWRNWLWDLGG